MPLDPFGARSPKYLDGTSLKCLGKARASTHVSDLSNALAKAAETRAAWMPDYREYLSKKKSAAWHR